jgi:hypothetical protein
VVPFNKSPEISVTKDFFKDLFDEWEDARIKFRKLTDKNINLPILYTGSILITKNFIRDRYVHMGFQSPFSYETVIQLTFKDGKLVSSKNISDIAKSIRKKKINLNKRPTNSNDYESMLNWVDGCFDLSFEKKVNGLLNDTNKKN